MCCGTIYIGLLNEVMLDQRYYQKCSNHQKCQTAVENNSEELSASADQTEIKTIDDAVFSEGSVMWSDRSDRSDTESETCEHQDTDTDEGFYDKQTLPSLVN